MSALTRLPIARKEQVTDPDQQRWRYMGTLISRSAQGVIVWDNGSEILRSDIVFDRSELPEPVKIILAPGFDARAGTPLYLSLNDYQVTFSTQAPSPYKNNGIVINNITYLIRKGERMQGGEATVNRVERLPEADGLPVQSHCLRTIILSDTHDESLVKQQVMQVLNSGDIFKQVFGIETQTVQRQGHNKTIPHGENARGTVTKVSTLMPDFGISLFEIIEKTKLNNYAKKIQADIDPKYAWAEAYTGTEIQRLQLALKIAQQIAALHAHGFVHQDLKPGNIIVDRHGDVQIVDFDFCEEIEHQTIPSGTPAYMSPETINAHINNEKCPIQFPMDQYSLGKLLIELLGPSCGYQTERLAGDAQTAYSNYMRNDKSPRDIQCFLNAFMKDQDISRPREITTNTQRLIAQLIERNPENRADISTVISVLSAEIQRVALKYRPVIQPGAGAPQEEAKYDDEYSPLPDAVDVSAIDQQAEVAPEMLALYQQVTQEAQRMKRSVGGAKATRVKLENFAVDILNTMQNKGDLRANDHSLSQLQSHYQTIANDHKHRRIWKSIFCCVKDKRTNMAINCATFLAHHRPTYSPPPSPQLTKHRRAGSTASGSSVSADKYQQIP